MASPLSSAFSLCHHHQIANPIFPFREVAGSSRPFSLLGTASSRRIRSEHNSERRRTKKTIQYKKPLDAKVTDSLKQKELLTLLRRIQSSISKGEPLNAETHLSEGTETRETCAGWSRAESGDEGFKLTRPPSNFVKQSPIQALSALRSQELEPHVNEGLACDEEEQPDMRKLKLAELKQRAKARGIKGYSKMKKAELLQLLGSTREHKHMR